MPDDLSGLREEFEEALLEAYNTPRAVIYLNGKRYVRRLSPGMLDPEDCDIRARRCFWCAVLGHKDSSPVSVQWVAICHCGALASYITDTDMPGGRFVHIGRCVRCNALHLPRARIVR